MPMTSVAASAPAVPAFAALAAGRPLAAVGACTYESLTEAECWSLLAAGALGRLAVIAPDGAPDVFPMNAGVRDGCLYLRSGPGSKLIDTARDPHVAFECDEVSSIWASSVVVRGIAERLDRDDEIESCGVLELVTVTPVTKWTFLRITPTAVTGRRYRVSNCRES